VTKLRIAGIQDLQRACQEAMAFAGIARRSTCPASSRSCATWCPSPRRCSPGPPLPLPATTCLESLACPAITSLGNVVRAFEALTDVPDRVTRGARAAGICVRLLVYYFGSGVLGRILAPGVNLTADQLQIPMHLTPAVVGVVLTAGLSVFAAAGLCSGVCLYASRIAVVTADGREASPLRAALRAAIVWSWPVMHLWAVAHGSRPLTSAPDVVAIAAIISAIASPARGLQDYLARTYLVPR
jgi:hypothetical protein